MVKVEGCSLAGMFVSDISSARFWLTAGADAQYPARTQAAPAINLKKRDLGCHWRGDGIRDKLNPVRPHLFSIAGEAPASPTTTGSFALASRTTLCCLLDTLYGKTNSDCLVAIMKRARCCLMHLSNDRENLYAYPTHRIRDLINLIQFRPSNDRQ